MTAVQELVLTNQNKSLIKHKDALEDFIFQSSNTNLRFFSLVTNTLSLDLLKFFGNIQHFVRKVRVVMQD